MGQSNDATNAALISSSAQLASTAGNMYAQANLNKKTRKWNEEMYAMQRRDALADWNMNNQYNSPEQQMARFKTAGLNPNLIYGQMQEVSAPRSTDVKSWNPEAPSITPAGQAIGSYFSQMYQYKTAEQNLKNLEAQHQAIQEETALKSAQTLKTYAETDTSKFDLGMKQTMADVYRAAQTENLRKLQIENQVTLDANERAALQSSQSLLKGAEEILSIRANRANTEAERSRIFQQIELLKKDNTVRELDVRLSKMGIRPSDPLYARLASTIIDNVTNNPKAQADFNEWNKKHGKPQFGGPGNGPQFKPVDSLWKNKKW